MRKPWREHVTSARPGAVAHPAGLPERCDAVVVGGGVLGLSSAYELARRNMSVVLIESGLVGARQSGRNLGFVRQQGRALAELPMMMTAKQRWRGLGDELGSDVEWQMGGNLRLTNDPGLASRYEWWAADAASLGLDSRVVSRAEVASILIGWSLAQYPRLITPDITIFNAAAPEVTLRLLTYALVAGAIVLFPSLFFLFRVFKGKES